jgi:hypothetical protein
MSGVGSIFFDISLPNAATWFYFSALLGVALFFKFSRLLSMRNWDVLTLFLLTPGFLLLADGPTNRFWGYLWLLGVSAYFFARCLFDLALVRRPALAPNLSLGGLVWMGGALFAGLVAVAARQPEEPSEPGPAPAPLDVVGKRTEAIVRRATGEADDAKLQLWAERGLTVVCHLVIAAALALIGWRHFDDLHGGVAAATFYLLLPYTYLLMPKSPLGVGQWDHAWPMAVMIWAVLAYRRPAIAGAVLGLAAGTVFFPVLLLPVWLSFYRRRGAARFALAFLLTAGVCLSAIGTVLWLNGELPQSLRTGWTSSAWKPWMQPAGWMHGLWEGMPSQWAYRLPVFLAYLAFLVVTALWPSPKNLAHVLALSAAVLLGIQFWYADQGGVYVLWYLPLLLLLVFRPNLSTCEPPAVEDDAVIRLGRRVGRLLWRLVRPPEPVRTA